MSDLDMTWLGLVKPEAEVQVRVTLPVSLHATYAAAAQQVEQPLSVVLSQALRHAAPLLLLPWSPDQLVAAARRLAAAGADPHAAIAALGAPKRRKAAKVPAPCPRS